MAGFLTNHEIIDALDAGQTTTGHFRKVPGLASTAGWWSDLSMAAGNPPLNFYASTPLVSATLSSWDGIYHGDVVTPKYLYLLEMMITASSANCVGQYTLCDYLMVYPFVDLDDNNAQTMTNSVTLPRYTDGSGVRAMLVAQTPTTGNGQFNFTYINQLGVEKTTPTQYYTSSAANPGALVTVQAAGSGWGRFVTLADGCCGIRSISSFTNTVSNGGLGAIVLVRPLAEITVSEINVPTEISFLTRRAGLPQIVDGAFLGLICNTAGSIASTSITGRLTYVWN